VSRDLIDPVSLKSRKQSPNSAELDPFAAAKASRINYWTALQIVEAAAKHRQHRLMATGRRTQG
jgi:hypothetical protein